MPECMTIDNIRISCVEYKLIRINPGWRLVIVSSSTQKKCKECLYHFGADRTESSDQKL